MTGNIESIEFNDRKWIRATDESPPIRCRVVREPSVDELVREVRYLQRAGWHPVGGV